MVVTLPRENNSGKRIQCFSSGSELDMSGRTGSRPQSDLRGAKRVSRWHLFLCESVTEKCTITRRDSMYLCVSPLCPHGSHTELKARRFVHKS
jgi:hypothetical protein